MTQCLLKSACLHIQNFLNVLCVLTRMILFGQLIIFCLQYDGKNRTANAEFYWGVTQGLCNFIFLGYVSHKAF